MNNVPAGATVWVTAHLDYALKGTKVASDFTRVPIPYGPFSSAIDIRDQATGALVGISFSSTGLIGRGKKVTVVYGTARNASGVPMPDVWVRVGQGSNWAMAKTDSTGFTPSSTGRSATTATASRVAARSATARGTSPTATTSGRRCRSSVTTRPNLRPRQTSRPA